MSRSENRHHIERMKQKRRFHWGRDLLKEPVNLSKAITTPRPCSCPGCKRGEPIKYAHPASEDLDSLALHWEEQYMANPKGSSILASEWIEV